MAIKEVSKRVSLRSIQNLFFEVFEEPSNVSQSKPRRALLSLPTTIDGRNFTHTIEPEQVFLSDITAGTLAYLRPGQICLIRIGNPSGGSTNRAPEPKTLVLEWDGSFLRIYSEKEFMEELDFSHATVFE